ncbi:MAG: anti-sigma factor [Planctomycetota bacterium]
MLLYAADQAEPEQRQLAERWLASGHPVAVGALAEARATLAALAEAATPLAAGDDQFDRLLDRIDSSTNAKPEPQPVPARDETLKLPTRPSGRGWIFGVAAAGLIAGIAVALWWAARGEIDRLEESLASQREQTLALQADAARSSAALREQGEQITALETQLTRAQTDLRQLQTDYETVRLEALASAEQAAEAERRLATRDAELAAIRQLVEQQRLALADPNALVTELAGTPDLPALTGRALIAGDRVQLFASQFDDLPENRTYQLWLLADPQGPVSLGVMQQPDGGRIFYTADLPGDEIPRRGLAVSIEPAGGSDAPTGPIVGVAPFATTDE